MFVDFGSGYGRVVDYFYKNFSFKKYWVLSIQKNLLIIVLKNLKNILMLNLIILILIRSTYKNIILKISQMVFVYFFCTICKNRRFN